MPSRFRRKRSSNKSSSRTAQGNGNAAVPVRCKEEDPSEVMAKHGRAVMPFGMHKGVRIRLLSDSYISWLTTWPGLWQAQWRWLKESVLAELRFRGLRDDLAATVEVEECQAVVSPYWNTLLQCTSETCHRPMPCPLHSAVVVVPEQDQPIRRIRVR
jgi:uncharacterized protein (DUF3820 family)